MRREKPRQKNNRTGRKKMFCSKCGAEIKEGHKFCMNCGAPVVVPTATRAATPRPAATPNPQKEQKSEPKAKKQKAPKAPKQQKQVEKAEAPKPKKGKAGTVVLIIVAAFIVVAIVLIALKLLWNDNPVETKKTDDDWAAVSDGTQDSENLSEEETDNVLKEQLQQVISEKGDVQGSNADLCKGKNHTGMNGVMGSAILDVSGDGVDDLIVVYAESNNICADVYTVEGDKAVRKARELLNYLVLII